MDQLIKIRYIDPDFKVTYPIYRTQLEGMAEETKAIIRAGQKMNTHNQTEIHEEKTIMKSSTKDQTKGKFHEVKGKVKEEVGKLTSNPKLAAEGKSEKRAGKVQQVIGKVKNIL